MLNPTRLKAGSSASNVIKYLEEGKIQDGKKTPEDYYLEEGKAPAKFTGSALERFGLSENYNPEDFERMFNNVDQNGEALVKHTREGRVPGWDLTMTAPKSVSMAWGIADDILKAEISKAVMESSEAALSHIEENVPITNQGKTGKGDGQVAGEKARANLSAAIFQHGTSRAGDPNLHVHSVVFNAAEREDGKVMSLNSTEIFKRQVEIGAAFRAELATKLQDLGFQIERDGRSFKIAGIDKEAEKHFSKRAEEIKESLADHGYDSGKARDAAALNTRDEKEIKDGEELRDQWREEASEFGLTSETLNELRQRDPEKEQEFPNEIDRQSILDALTNNQSVFSERDIWREVAIEAQGITDQKGIADEVAEFMKDERLVKLENSKGEIRYSSIDMVKTEREMADSAYKLGQSEQHKVSSDKVDQALNDFFKKKGFNLSAEQQDAVRHVTEGKDVTIVQGGAGTGKSTMLEAARMAWDKDGYRVRGAAIAGKAASGLEEDANIESKTLAKTVMDGMPWTDDQGKHHEAKDPFTKNDIIVIDEAGMIDSRTMNQAMKLASDAEAKVVLVGDTRQLQPIMAGGAMKAIQDAHGIQEINEIRRQKEGENGEHLWKREAINAAAKGDATKALSEFQERGHFHIAEDRDKQVELAINKWRETLDVANLKESLILCNLNKDVRELNSKARDLMKQEHRLGVEHQIDVTDREGNSLGHRDFAEGDRVIFKRNDKDIAVKNGQLGSVKKMELRDTGWVMHMKMDDGRSLSVDTAQYSNLEHGYAVTTHAAQGVTVDNATVMVGGNLQNLHSTYVQLSRMRDNCEIVASQDMLERQMHRMEPSSEMVERAQKLGMDDAHEASYVEVHHHLKENDQDYWKTEVSDLIQSMNRDQTKGSTLDYKVVDEVEHENIDIPSTSGGSSQITEIEQQAPDQESASDYAADKETAFNDSHNDWAAKVESERKEEVQVQPAPEPEKDRNNEPTL